MKNLIAFGLGALVSFGIVTVCSTVGLNIPDIAIVAGGLFCAIVVG